MHVCIYYEANRQPAETNKEREEKETETNKERARRDKETAE